MADERWTVHPEGRHGQPGYRPRSRVAGVHRGRSRRRTDVAVAATAVALLLAMCGPAGASTSAAASTASPGGHGVVTGYGVEPEGPLLPTSSSFGSAPVLDLLFDGLVRWDARGVARNEVATSITTQDAQHYDITIRSGLKFSNGEQLTARSFVDAWNFGALSSNQQPDQGWFEPIAGFADVSYCEPGEPDSEGNPTCTPAPKSMTMNGLQVVSDTWFTVDLTAPTSDFVQRLGAPAFYPMAAAALADVGTAGERPIGNGPYQLALWTHQQRIELVPNPKYRGPRNVRNSGVTFLLYDDPATAFDALLSGNLDVMSEVGGDFSGRLATELGGRVVMQPGPVVASLSIPTYLPHFGPGREGMLRRAAISLLIDRELLCAENFAGTKVPATDFLTPSIPGWSNSLPGHRVLQFAEQRAQKLWAKADAIAPWAGTFSIAYSGEGFNETWYQPLVEQIHRSLGIAAEVRHWDDFFGLFSAIINGTMESAYRIVWYFDYPSPYNSLSFLYHSGSFGNDSRYANPHFDDLVDRGRTASSLERGLAKFQRAESILLDDLPAIPLWYANSVGGYSTKVSGVRLGWRGNPVYNLITVD